MANTQWIVSTVAGTGEEGFSGDGGPAMQALLNNPFDLAFDPGGSICRVCLQVGVESRCGGGEIVGVHLLLGQVEFRGLG